MRRCEIHDCGQTGIVGHLGGVFSVIEDNHIHHINNKQNLAGAEIGGIKCMLLSMLFSAATISTTAPVVCGLTGRHRTRVTGNLFHDNALPNDFEAGDDAVTSVGEDIFVEVSHGPTLIDHNILLSDRALKIATQGVALVHNLICGGFVSVGIGTDNGAPDIPSPRYTPYHTKHGTQVAGFMTILHGDDRFYNNIFVQKPIRPCMQDLADLMGNNGNMWDDCNVITGTSNLTDIQPLMNGTDSSKVTAEWVLRQQATAIMIIFLYGIRQSLFQWSTCMGKRNRCSHRYRTHCRYLC